MSEIQVNTINEYTGANGVTIDGVLVKDGAIASSYISGLSGGLSSAQQFRLTANVTSTGYLTANWEVPDTSIQGNLGSIVSEASGVFSFSETGYYLVNFTAECQVYAVSSTNGNIQIYSTNDNTNYTQLTSGRFGGTSDYDITVNSTSVILDVTNTTNDKVKFYFQLQTGNPRINGSTTENKTYVTFLKLGDT